MQQRSNSARPSSAVTTYKSVAEAQLTKLCEALGQQGALSSYLDVQNTLMGGWGDTEVPEKPPYPSAIGDDHSPYEYSIAFGPSGPQLRILCEAQGAPLSLANNYRTALRLTDALHEKYGIDVRRFAEVRELFNPQCSLGTFSLWHAVTLSPDHSPEFKVYLNPQIRGRAEASRIVREALDRLGFGTVAERIIDQLGAGGRDHFNFNYFSLDMSNGSRARVKIYASHPDATARDVERAFAIVPTHREGDVVEFCQSLVGHAGPFTGKPVSSCFAMVEGSDLPKTATFHLPVARYIANDAIIGERVTTVLKKHGLDADVLNAVLGKVPSRALEDQAGFQSYASFRREPSGMRVTVYLSPELFSPARPASGSRRTGSIFPPPRAR